MNCILIIFIFNKFLIYKQRKLDLSNEIIIKINGAGIQHILNSGYIFKPTETLLNGALINLIEENKILISEKGENIITMKWNNKLIDCSFMFNNLTNITEVDLTKFDSSDVKTMYNMFDGCTNLKKIIINNTFDTSKVEDMSFIFPFVLH